MSCYANQLKIEWSTRYHPLVYLFLSKITRFLNIQLYTLCRKLIFNYILYLPFSE